MVAGGCHGTDLSVSQALFVGWVRKAPGGAIRRAGAAEGVASLGR